MPLVLQSGSPSDTKEDKDTSADEPKQVTTTKPAVPTNTKPAPVKKQTKQPEKFGIQTEKGKVIWAFRNGDKHHEGAKITVHPTKFKTYDQVSRTDYQLNVKLKEFMSKEVQLPTGAVNKVYTPEGKLLKGLEDFQDGGKYICTAGSEKFDSESSNTVTVTILISLSSKCSHRKL